MSCFELSGGPETLGWTVGVSSAHFNQHKKCANARFSLFFFFFNLHFSFYLADHQYKLRCVSWNRY